ncbi:hypothetical protein GCM10010411_75420 [Actinomadura fulvescens]|uniref:RNA polymerase sigma-70 region 4 domain-containing protein n=1 Tax=Actinomadura fulvescens TaxID=46160 RepID=A0ABP6CXZ0_9ACTN
MTKRRGQFNDPTARRATREDARILHKVLNTLTPQQAAVISMHFGLDDGTPKDKYEIGRELDLTREHIDRLLVQAMDSLRDPDRLRMLSDSEGGFVDLTGAVLSSLSDEELGIVRCLCCPRRFARGSATIPDPVTLLFQRAGVIPPGGRTVGRPRKYCSDKCKQKAHRRRRASSSSQPRRSNPG